MKSISTALFALIAFASYSQDCIYCAGDEYTISSNVTDGTPPFTYLWSTGATTETIQGDTSNSDTYSVTVTDSDGCSVVESIIVDIIDMSVVIPVIANYCSGETQLIESTVTGGTSPYTYSWSNGETGSSFLYDEEAPPENNVSVTIVVIVTDSNGCTSTDEEQFAILSTPTVMVSEIIPQVCDNLGSICLEFVNHNTRTGIEFSFDDAANWTPSVNDNTVQFCDDQLTAGTYTIWSRWGNNQCPVEIGTYVVPDASYDLIVTTASTPEMCNANNTADGTAIASSSGGSVPYTYDWSNGGTTSTITDLSAGSYEVTATDVNGCTGTSEVVVDDLDDCPCPVITVSAIDIIDETCTQDATSDGSIEVDATGGTPAYTYDWSNGSSGSLITGLVAGSYIVTATDANGCTGVNTFDVLDLDDCCDLTSTFTVVDETCNADNTMDGEITAIPAGGTPPYSYNWSTSETTATITGLSEGSYQVTITDFDGCEKIETVDVVDLDDCCIEGVEMTEQFGSPSQTCNTQRFFNWIDLSCTCCSGTFTITYDKWMEYPAGSGTFLYTGVTTETESCTTALDPQVPLNVCQLDANVNFEVGIEITAVTSTDPDCNTDHLIGLTWTRTDFITQGWYDTCCGVDCDDFTVTGVVVDETCNDDNTSDGSIDLTVSGSSGYTYNWSNGATTQDISNLSAGNYNVTVTDVDGCEELRGFTVDDLDDCDCPVVFSTGTVTPETCNDNNTMDGSVNITPFGGAAPYSYSWSNGSSSQDIFNLSAGTYSVTITDVDGCTGVSNYVVGDDDNCPCNCSPVIIGECPFTWGLSGTDCAGLTGTLQYNGTSIATQFGFGNNTYDPCSNEGNGTYTLVMSSGNGCPTTTAVKVVDCCDPCPNITISQIQLENETCGNDNTMDGLVEVSASGGSSPYSYSWSNGANTALNSGLTAGTYTVTVTDDDGCTGTASYLIIDENDCSSCGCEVELVDDGDCTLSSIVSGTDCQNYELIVQKYGNDDCTNGNGNCTVAIVPNPISGATYFHNDLDCFNDGTTEGGYRATLLGSNGCSNYQDNCLFIEECTSFCDQCSPTFPITVDSPIVEFGSFASASCNITAFTIEIREGSTTGTIANTLTDDNLSYIYDVGTYFVVLTSVTYDGTTVTQADDDSLEDCLGSFIVPQLTCDGNMNGNPLEHGFSFDSSVTGSDPFSFCIDVTGEDFFQWDFDEDAEPDDIELFEETVGGTTISTNHTGTYTIGTTMLVCIEITPNAIADPTVFDFSYQCTSGECVDCDPVVDISGLTVNLSGNLLQIRVPTTGTACDEGSAGTDEDDIIDGGYTDGTFWSNSNDWHGHNHPLPTLSCEPADNSNQLLGCVVQSGTHTITTGATSADIEFTNQADYNELKTAIINAVITATTGNSCDDTLPEYYSTVRVSFFCGSSCDNSVFETDFYINACEETNVYDDNTNTITINDFIVTNNNTLPECNNLVNGAVSSTNNNLPSDMTSCAAPSNIRPTVSTRKYNNGVITTGGDDDVSSWHYVFYNDGGWSEANCDPASNGFCETSSGQWRKGTRVRTFITDLADAENNFQVFERDVCGNDPEFLIYEIENGVQIFP